MNTYQNNNKNSVSRNHITTSISYTTSKPSYSSTKTYIPSHTNYSYAPTRYTYNNYESVTPKNNVGYYSSHSKYTTSNIPTVYSRTPVYESHYYPLKYSEFQSSRPDIRINITSDPYSKNIDNLSQINKESSINSLDLEIPSKYKPR